MQSGGRERALTASLLAGHFFVLSEITQIMSALGILRPSSGSGKNGAVLKKDLVTALVKHVLRGRDDVTDEKLKEIIDKISGESKRKTNEETTPELIQAVSCLDPQDQADFEPLVKSCIDELEEEHKLEMAKLKPADKEKKMTDDNDKPDKGADDEVPKDKAPKDKPEDSKKQKTLDADKLKPSLEKAMETPLPAHLRKAPEAKQPRAPQKGRRPTPDVLKRLLPEIELMYLTWSPENRMVSVDFQGYLHAVF